MAHVVRIDEMAAYLKTYEKTLIDLADSKQIPHIRQGDLILFPKEEVVAAIASKGIEIPDSSAAPMPVEERSSPAEPQAPRKRGPGRPNTKKK